MNTTHCFVCGTACRTVKSNQVSPLCRTIIYICKNQECQTIFEAQVIPVRIVVPGSLPIPECALSLARAA